MNHGNSRSTDWLQEVEKFPPDVRNDIDSIWEHQGMMTARTAREVASKMAIPIEELMMRLLPIAQQYAIVPVSRFKVGAVAAGMKGTDGCSLYFGANFEFSDLALSFSVHGEQAATNNAWIHEEPGIEALAISAPPCGYCRQFLFELSTAEELSILLPSSDKQASTFTSTPLTQFLPRAFGPKDLGIEGGLMDPKLGKHHLTLSADPPGDPVVSAALAAASRSYAPYQTAYPPVPIDQSHAFAGVAIQTEDDEVYSGQHAVNAAYNPSLSPLQSALAFMNINRPLGASRQITRAVLVEAPTLASQLSATKAALAAFAPEVDLEYHLAKYQTA